MSIHRRAPARFCDVAIKADGFIWDATDYGSHVTVRVGFDGDIFARASAPMPGHPNLARHFAEVLLAGIV